jgi:hypothetical protein
MITKNIELGNKFKYKSKRIAEPILFNFYNRLPRIFTNKNHI